MTPRVYIADEIDLQLDKIDWQRLKYQTSQLPIIMNVYLPIILLAWLSSNAKRVTLNQWNLCFYVIFIAPTARYRKCQ